MRFVFATTALLAGAGAAAQDYSPVSAVVLYPGSATIERTAQVAAGASRVVVAGLATDFPLQSLRVDADPGIHIERVDSQDTGRVAAANPEQAELEERIEALEGQKGEIDAGIDAAAIVRGYLERLPGAAADSGKTAPDAKNFDGLLEAIARRAGDTTGKAQRLGAQKRELQKRIDALHRDLGRLRAASRDSRTLTVHLQAQRSGTLRISYQVQSAGWRPGYRAELDSKTSTVRLTRTAIVSQKTGEAWKDVRLVFSTSQPQLSPEAPLPPPWLLSYEPPEARLEFRKAPAELAAPAPAAQASMAVVPARAAADVSERPAESFRPPTFQTEETYATTFETSAPATINADGKEATLELGRLDIPARQTLRVVPRLASAATLVADAARPEGVWPAGPLQLFRDGNFVGVMSWSLGGTDRLELSFGRDELVRAAIDPVKADTAMAGFFEKRSERRLADVIRVTNLHPQPMDVLVLESSPVSVSDEVRIDSKFVPEPSLRNWEDRRGVVGWNARLQAGETAKFDVAYRLEYPQYGVVSGIDLR